MSCGECASGDGAVVENVCGAGCSDQGATGERASPPERSDTTGVRKSGFQPVSLAGEIEAAKVLAYAMPRLREGVQRVEGAGLEMTAIVEPVREMGEQEERMERYRFGLSTMEREEIRVMTVRDLRRVADTARLELRV